MYTPLFYFLLKLPGGPATVTTVHELIDAKSKYGGGALYWPMRIYYTVVYRSMVKLSDVVILHTSESAKTLSQYAKTNNAEIVPLACTVSPTFLPEEECKASLGLAGKRMVTMFGFISRFKGHDLAIEAMKNMPEDVVLYIAGEGRSPEDNAYIDALKEKVEQMGLHGRVIFAGYVSDDKAPAVMCASDIVLLPYRHVVQSSALNYALAYLKPVLASDMGGFAEVARAYGCIKTFRPEDVDDLKAKLLLMLGNRSCIDTIMSRAPAYVKAVSLRSVIERTICIYERILSGNGPWKSQ
jgi:glycosyltransferase involved in cell wall biosynthesis